MRRFFGKMCFGVSAWCLAAAMCVCGASAAETPSQRLRATVDQVLLVLQEPEYRNPATRAPLRAKIERQVRTVFDFEEFSARTVGKSWPSFTAEQKKRFDDAFAELLLVTYLDKIQGYNGEQVMYTGEVLSSRGDRSCRLAGVLLRGTVDAPAASGRCSRTVGYSIHSLWPGGLHTFDRAVWI